MALQFRQSRVQRLRSTAQNLISRALDRVYAPVISRLTDEEYFSCRTRGDCVRAYFRRLANG